MRFPGVYGLLEDTQLGTGPGGEHGARLEIVDTAADGHHARARYLTRTGNGKLRYWPWHANYKGKGERIVVTTSAQDRVDGIRAAGIEVATAEGDKILESCVDWVDGYRS